MRLHTMHQRAKRRARRARRARMARFIETVVAERLTSMRKLTPAEMAHLRVRVEPHIVMTFEVGE